ncbi:MAG: hemolysin III family protein [Bacillota bacterium]|nr:hemolysin III family protein [Bacillota bacterium]
MTEQSTSPILKKEYPHFYTLAEELCNAITHGIGAGLAVAALVIMVVTAARHGSAIAVVSSAICGATMIILYTASTLYHSFTNPKIKALFRIFDHCTIFLLIAGTYTPMALVAIGDTKGWWLFGVIWGAAILGIVLNAISLERFKKLSMVLYLAMGWAAVVTFPALKAALGFHGLVFLFAGGISYTVGVIFYALNHKLRFMHSVWHVFVLGGTVLHFFCILFYIL